MTAAEMMQINLRLDDFREDNRLGHEDIKVFIKDVETRLTNKIVDRDSDVDGILAHCRAREIEVSATFAAQLVSIDAHIAAAQIAAVAEAKKPSVYTVATRGALDGLLHFAAKATIVVVLISGVWVLAEKIGLL